MVLPSWLSKHVLILGCGNVLFGDDGFGPAVADYIINNHKIPDDVCILNVGTSAGKLLFDIALSEETKLKKIILIDTVTLLEKTPGEVFILPINTLPPVKIWDFSLHQMPGANILRTLKHDRNIEIILIVVQGAVIPQEVRPGLSSPVAEAVPYAAEMVLKYAMNNLELKISTGKHDSRLKV